MSIVLAFIAGVAVIAGWWLSRQGLGDKPWLETGAVTAVPSPGGLPVGKMGLGVFLGVVGVLFALTGSAVVMRMGFADWFELRLPRVVWASTALLMLSSVALHIAQRAARSGDERLLRLTVAVGGLTAAGFLAGQLAAWSALAQSGQTLASNPGVSFFYLIAGLHGLHIIGGLVALGRVGLRLRERAVPDQTARSVTLCAIYWHALLIVWVAMLTLLMGWASDVVSLCRAILT